MPLQFRDDLVALFPGQGSLSQGVGAPWRSSPHWSVVEDIADITGVNVPALLLESPLDELIRTDRAQLATFALSMVGWHDLIAKGPLPRYLLGHSLGEFSALVASGLLDLTQGATLIATRGSAMAEAASAIPGSMTAVMGTDGSRSGLETIPGVWIANVNGTGQIVLSGTPEGLALLAEQHRELGWKRATPLNVGGAFHSPLMASAQEALDGALTSVTWGTTQHQLIANVDGQLHNDASSWAALLSRQLTSPVEFLAATLALPDTVTTTIEMPPGSVLTGLTKRIRPFTTQLSPSSAEEMKEITL
jgi:[acyl-carrier-protein] S-malonyltransferase